MICFHSFFHRVTTTAEQDYEACLEAVERGEVWAKTKLAWYKLSGIGGCEIDEKGAVALLEERVMANDADAMWMLGLCNEFGKGCEQNISRAELLYQRSSDEGNFTGLILVRNRKEHERGSGYLKCSSL